MLRLGSRMLPPCTKSILPSLISILLKGSDTTSRSTRTKPVKLGAAPVPPACRLMVTLPRARLLWIRNGSSVRIAMLNFQSLKGGVSTAIFGIAPAGGWAGAGRGS